VSHHFPKNSVRVANQGECTQQEFYRFCAVVIQPTDVTENWPRVGFEAMASGSVLIVDNQGRWRRQISQGVTGWLCNDEQDFIEYASKMAHEPEIAIGDGPSSETAGRGAWGVQCSQGELGRSFQGDPLTDSLPTAFLVRVDRASLAVQCAGSCFRVGDLILACAGFVSTGGLALTGQEAAREIASVYRAHGSRLTAHLLGQYGGIIVDPTTPSIVLLQDSLGLRTVYFYLESGCFSWQRAGRPDQPHAYRNRVRGVFRALLGVTTRKCAICPVREAAAMLARSAIRAEKTIFKQKGSVSRSVTSPSRSDCFRVEQLFPGDCTRQVSRR
jgi:hypothetical protein